MQCYESGILISFVGRMTSTYYVENILGCAERNKPHFLDVGMHTPSLASSVSHDINWGFIRTVITTET